jgi:hypothetical protein
MASELEQWWVQRANRILRDEKHFTLTRFFGGSPADQGFDNPDLRWPGYLGPRFTKGSSVLAVGNIHCPFRSKNFDPASGKYEPHLGQAVDDALAGTAELKNAERASEDTADRYLSQVRPMYEYGLSGSWAVGDTFRKAFDAVGVGTDPEAMQEIAYVNASCCQVPASTPLPARLIDHCLATHSLADLVSVLRPIAVVTCSVRAFDHLERAGMTNEVTTVCFAQRVGSRYLERRSWIGGSLFEAGPRSTDWPEPLGRQVERLREIRALERA